MKCFWISVCVAVACALVCEIHENEKCKPRDVVVDVSFDNRYFPYKIQNQECAGSCDSLSAPVLSKC